MRNKKFVFFILILSFFRLFSYERIVTLAPALGEIVCSLGESKKIVGVSSYSEENNCIKDAVKVGTIFSLNYEILLSLRPDLILTYAEDVKTERLLKELNVKVVKFKHTTVNDILDSILKIGLLLDKKGKAEKIVKDIQSKLTSLSNKIKKRKKVLVIISRQRPLFKNIYILGKGDFLSELLSLTGGDNVYNGSVQYPKVSGEFIIRSNPEIIMELIPDLKERGLKKAEILKEWKNFYKGKFYKKVAIMDEKHIVIPGPRIYLIAKKFYEVLNSVN